MREKVMGKVHWILIGIAVLVVLVAFGNVIFRGPVTPPNKVCLVLKSIGDRSAKISNSEEQTKVKAKIKTAETGEVADTGVPQTDKEDDLDMFRKTFSAELITAKRAPMKRPGLVRLWFPLGLQSYEFSGKASIESPENEAIEAPAVGGTVTFSVLYHMHIDRTFPDLAERLLAFAGAYQLIQYNGSDDVLAKLMSGRLKEELLKPFIEYCANKRPLTLMRGKDGVNEYALTELNKKFNRFGIRFTVAAISSAITIPQEQQTKLDGMVIEDAKLQALEFWNINVKPLDESIARFEQEGETGKQGLINAAKAEKIRLITEAEKKRRAAFIEIIGIENYVRLEKMLITVDNLSSGKTELTILPKDSRLFLSEGVVSERRVSVTE